MILCSITLVLSFLAYLVFVFLCSLLCFWWLSLAFSPACYLFLVFVFHVKFFVINPVQCSCFLFDFVGAFPAFCLVLIYIFFLWLPWCVSPVSRLPHPGVCNHLHPPCVFKYLCSLCSLSGHSANQPVIWLELFDWFPSFLVFLFTSVFYVLAPLSSLPASVHM